MKKTLENIIYKVLDTCISIINKVAYINTDGILERRGNNQLERSLRGLIFIPAYFTIVSIFIVFGIPLFLIRYKIKGKNDK